MQFDDGIRSILNIDKISQQFGSHLQILNNEWNNCLTRMANPYQQLYRKQVENVSQATTMGQAEKIATHMSLMYNAFGCVLKDLVSLLSHLYSDRKQLDHPFSDPKNSIKASTKAKQQQKTKDIVNIHDNLLPLSLPHQKDSKEFDFNKYKFNIRDQKHNLPTQEKNSLTINAYQRTTKNSIDNQKQTKQKPVSRIQVVRGKQQRETLNGYSCTMCEKFYKALGEDYMDYKGRDKLCNDCSRHRSNLPPTNFYSDFSQEFGFQD